MGQDIISFLNGDAENSIWLVSYSVVPGALGDYVCDGVIPVVARNEYEAIGKAMTIDGIDATTVLPDSLHAYPLSFKNPIDRHYIIRLELSDKVQEIFKSKTDD